MSKRRGSFITFEGIDGSGKTTQARRVADLLGAAGLDVVLLRDPGGTVVGEQIRAILLDPTYATMSDACELLLYEASRAQLVSEAIRPALERASVVVCDRYFDSTYAYQHGGRGLDEDLVRRCNELGSCGVVPDLTLVLDLDVSTALMRTEGRDPDRLEAEGLHFQERIRESYLRLAKCEPARVRVVDGDAGEDEVFSRVVTQLVEACPQFCSALGEDARPFS